MLQAQQRISAVKLFINQQFTKLQKKYPRKLEAQIMQQITKKWQQLEPGKKIEYKNKQSQLELESKEHKNQSALRTKAASKQRTVKDSQSKRSEEAQSQLQTPSKNATPEKDRLEVLLQSTTPKREERGYPSPWDDEESSPMNSEYIFTARYNKQKVIQEQSEEGSEGELQQMQEQNQQPIVAPEAYKRPEMQKQYTLFCLFYMQKLSSQHPSWSHHQKQTIISLLWKKRKLTLANTETNPVEKTENKTKQIRKMSGRMMYAKQKSRQGCSTEQIAMNWKKLPRQSKKFWSIKGSDIGGESSRMEKTTGNLKFMNKQQMQKEQKCNEKGNLDFMSKVLV